MSDTEVHAKLTLDDAASAALEHIKGKFEQVNEKVKETTHELLNMAKQAAAVAVGFQLSGLIDSFKELGEETFHAAGELQNQTKELAGLIAVTDGGVHSFKELNDQAAEMGERLEGAATASGVTKAQMVDAFEMIAQRSTRGVEAVADMTEKMALASRALPGGMARMSEAWRDLEMGFIRPRNALLMLMKQTGVVEGPIKKVGAALNKLMQDPTGAGREKVFQLAESAIAKMAERTKDMPMTFEQISNSLKNVREAIFEGIGMPMLRAVQPAFEKMLGYFKKHREEIEKIAQSVGVKVGEWITEAATKIQEGFEYLRAHADEIMNALTKGGAALMAAIKFMVDHKELILGLAVAQKLGPGAASLAGGVAKALPGIGTALGEGAGALTASSAAGFGAAVGTFAFAAATWAWAAQQDAALREEAGIGFFDAAGRFIQGVRAANAESSGGKLKSYHGSAAEASNAVLNLHASMRALQAAMTNGDPPAQLGVLAGKLDAMAIASVEVGEKVDASVYGMSQAAHRLAADAGAAAFAEHMDQVRKQTVDVDVATHEFLLTVQRATADHKKTVEQAASTILAVNPELLTALAGTGSTVKQGIDAIKKALNNMPDTDKLELTPTVNMGGVTVVMQQDFRDQDPDRIALIFRRDLMRAAMSPLSAKTGQPIGL